VRDQASADTRDIHAEAAARVVDVYRRRVEYGGIGDDDAERKARVQGAERLLRAVAARAERDEYYRLRLSGEIDDPIHQKLVRELDVLEATPPPPPQNPV
jgi:CPA1 family monovalent cation:H+ antiporter